MKVIKEALVDMGEIKSYKDEFNSMTTDDNKKKIVMDFLSKVVGKGSHVYKGINDLPSDLVSQWIGAMKWEELALGTDNDFVKFLDDYGRNNSDESWIYSKRIFPLIYNMYANNVDINLPYKKHIMNIMWNDTLYNNDENSINIVKEYINDIKKINDSNKNIVREFIGQKYFGRPKNSGAISDVDIQKAIVSSWTEIQNKSKHRNYNKKQNNEVEDGNRKSRQQVMNTIRSKRVKSRKSRRR